MELGFSRSNSNRFYEALGRDRISDLPDPILLHIISFLDAKQAVLTGILSSRWKGLWSSSPNLIFVEDNFRKPSARRFISFVHRSLSLHSAPWVSALRVCCSYGETYAPVLNAAILLAIQKGVRKIELELTGKYVDSYELPSQMFGCESLVFLKLKMMNVKASAPFGFRSLVVLSLSWIELNGEFLQQVLDGCPVLQDLVVDRCRFSSSLSISSSHDDVDLRLKRLTIEKDEFFPSTWLEIRAPNLQFLKLARWDRDLCLEGLSSLLEVSLDLWLDSKQRPFLESLLSCLSHVKVLHLSSRCIEVMSVPLLQNLHSYVLETKCLLLETQLQGCEVQGLANLLWSSCNLETLVIKLAPLNTKLTPFTVSSRDTMGLSGRIHSEGRDYWESLAPSFPCLVQHLKTIRIIGFMGLTSNLFPDRAVVKIFTENLIKQARLVRFLLKNAMVLERMIVKLSSKLAFLNAEEWLRIKLVVIESLKDIPRASSRAELLFLR